MKKILLTLTILLLLLISLPAKDYRDVSLSFGHQAWQENITGIDLFYGMNVGITSRLESSIWGESTLTPNFFKKNSMGLGLSYALLAERSNGNKIAGSSLNMLLNGGIIFSCENKWNYFIPTDVYLSITGLTLGSPINGRRQRMMELGVSYNWFTNRVGVLFSFFKFDYYIRGSWRDYQII